MKTSNLRAKRSSVPAIALFVFAVLFVCLPTQAKGQITDSCWCLPLSYPPTGQLINQDSAIVFDTCAVRYPFANCDSVFWNNINSDYHSEAYRKVYAKYYWDVKFDVPAIPLDSARGDSLLYVNHDAIDSINYPNIKNGFKQLENNYGPYILRKLHPDEKTGKRSQYFSLYFDNYVKIVDVLYSLDTMEHVYCEFANMPVIQGSNVNDEKSKEDKIKLKIYPNPSAGVININITNSNYPKQEIKIYNVLNELIYNYTYSIFNENFILNIDLSFLPNGYYIIKNGSVIEKFIINK